MCSLEQQLEARRQESLHSSTSSIASLEDSLKKSKDEEKRLNELVRRAEENLAAKEKEVTNYQDMLEQSQGQYILLEKKYYKAKKIIKEYQSRERDFLHREEYHVSQLEEKDTHYNALLKTLKDKVPQPKW